MKKQSLAVTLSIAAMTVATFSPVLSLAATKTTNMPVQAQVNVNCNFTSSPTMNFGVYDNLATTDLAGSGSVSVRCTQGAVTTLGISTGSNAANAPSGSMRAMKHATANSYLGYDIYKDNTASPTLWTNSGTGLVTYTSTSNAPATINIYGKIPQLQDVPAGTYTDTVVITITY